MGALAFPHSGRSSIRPHSIFLFDVDLTLIHSGGAGVRAMERTFRALYGVPDAFAGMEFAGRTDGAILRECYLRHALYSADDLLREFARFRDVYFGELAEVLTTEGNCRVLPGVHELLKALGARDDVVLGLGTGNYREAARLKLDHVGLWYRFMDGGFADDAEDRAELIASGIARLSGGATVDGERVWIVGDSPHDVRAAKANGARVLGVATGNCSAEDLLAGGADVVMPDLSDIQAVISQTLS
jgi:phosphoglycolate phosphatase-like HAD superfamily hydrolase